MSTAAQAPELEFGPWNPGVESPVPQRLLHLCTIFRPENTLTPLSEARELRSVTGLPLADVVVFRPERLALHELLIRVSADLSVPDGPRIEDLGINFRRIASELLRQQIEPRYPAIRGSFEKNKQMLSRAASAEAARLFERRYVGTPGDLVRAWERSAQSQTDPVARAIERALAGVVAAVLARHGRLWGSAELLASIATNIASNEFCSDEIGRLIEPWIAESVRSGAYRMLPRQDQPLVMNTKGASASGKSTIRPLQRALAANIGTSWSDFALISPDIWRKQLLDYASLGAAYKYAGAFTGDELRIIDQKLDRYIARKAERGDVSHLLIDRFRFDSFAPDSDVAGSNLLTRFGSIVYLFFMITPPALLVERAWRRGLDVGRYKAVDDTLAHAVEAYSGMPELFFTWVERTDKRVHFEFLDNGVQPGERPRTVAFGWNENITVLDVKALLDIERYCRIDVNAAAPDELFRDQSVLTAERNAGFVCECARRFASITFADQTSGRAYLRLESGVPVRVDRAGLTRALTDEDTRAALNAVLRSVGSDSSPIGSLPQIDDGPLTEERAHTIGSWGAQPA